MQDLPTTQSYIERRTRDAVLESGRFGVGVLGHFAGASVLVLLLVDTLPLLTSAGWLVVLTLLLAGQSHWSKRTLAAPTTTVERDLHRATLWTIAIAIWWTLGTVYFFLVTTDERLYVLFMTGGVALAMIGSQYVHIASSAWHLVLTVLPFVALSLIHEEHLQALVLGIFLVVVARLTYILNNTYKHTLQLAYERGLLLNELTATARALEEANNAKSKFLAQASHDLRQPLHAVGLFMETISDYPRDTKVGKVIERVRQSIAMLSKLFDSLLDTSLLDAGHVEARPTVFPIADLFGQLDTDMSPLARSAGVDLRCVDTRLWVRTDPVLLRRMVQNLVSNAIRYANTRVLIGVRRTNSEHVAIWIADDGPGISTSDQARIFQEFVRVETERATALGAENTPGLGLGLAIVQRLALLLDLDIGISSELGTGSCFKVTGLKRSAAQAEAQSTYTTPTIDLFTDALVFVIDDDEQTLQATGALLTTWACNVQLFERAPDVSDCRKRPDAIITDYELIPPQSRPPESADTATGFDVITALRTHFDHPIPAVIISGNSTPTLKTQAADARIPLLHKPVRPAQLKSALLSSLVKSAS